jgi:PAS domain S-box-containing protein
MDAKKRKELVSQVTVMAVIFSIVVFLAAVFMGLMKSEEATFSTSGVIWLFVHNPGYWFLILFVFVFPLTSFWLARKFTRQVMEKQAMIDHEQERMQRINQFTQHLIQDDFDIDFKLSGSTDELGNSLVRLRDTLKTNKENARDLKISEDQRNYVSEGLARISEILRNNLHDPEQLSFNVIKELTKKVNAIQGGFYILDNTDKLNRFFNLIAFFAYDRRKFTDQQVKWGDGLIGTCAMEQKVIHIKSIPDSYISVTSGLGESNPDSLLIVPMQYENEIYGVLEFASFQKFDQDHINLITQAAESVASTLSAVRTNMTTARLLEESKAQTQAMTSHEEEMRQNMEELQATQEDAMRQAQRFSMLEDTINQSLIKAEFSIDGKFLLGNIMFFSKMEYDQNGSTHGKTLIDFISEDSREHFQEIWKKLLADGQPYTGYLKHSTRTGKSLWTVASLVMTKTEDSENERIIFLGLDASDEVVRVQKNEIICELASKLGIRFELDVNGNFQDYNHHFMHLLKYTQKDLKAMVIYDMIDAMDLELFNKHWETITTGNTHTGLLRIKSSHGEEKWINGSFAAVFNMSHEISRIVFTGFDVTREKMLEKETLAQADAIRKQEKMLKDSEKEMTKRVREVKNELLSRIKETERMLAIHSRVIDEAPEAIVITGQNNQINHFNKAAELLFDMKREDVINQDVGVLFPEQLAGKDELIDSFTRPGDQKITGKRKETYIIDKNGKEKKIMIQLAKARIDNENTYTAFLQPVKK